MTDIRAVLFDLGNVLVDVDVNMFWRSLGFDGPEAIAPYADALRAWAMRYEAGEFATIEFVDGLGTILEGRFTSEELVEAFDQIIREPIDGMASIVSQVAAQRRTALVSNTNELHHHGSIRRVPALRHLHRQYVSYQLKVMKPGRKFYEAIIRDQQLRPEQMIFIDDLEENVKGAVDAGMRGIRFVDVVSLEKELRALKIL